MGVDKIIRLVGVLVAVVAGLWQTAEGGTALPYGNELIVVIGLVGGYFVADDDRPRFYMATVAIYAVAGAGAAGALPVVGGYIDDVMGSLSHLFGAACVTALVMSTIDRVKP